MPLRLRRQHDSPFPDFLVHSGRHVVGRIIRHSTGPGSYWSWSVFDLLARETCGTRQEAMEALASTWRAHLAQAHLEEVPEDEFAVLSASSNRPPPPAILARDAGRFVAWPDDHYLVLSGSVIVGSIVQDPLRETLPRIRRQPVAPWLWMASCRAGRQSDLRLHGGAGSMDEARDQHARHWRLWLAGARLREI